MVEVIEIVLHPFLFFVIFVLVLAAVYVVTALGLNLQWGYTGLFNIGVAAFMAVGAYTSAILTAPPAFVSPAVPGHLGGFSQPFWVGLLGAIAVSGLLGYLIALPTLRLREDYLAIATLGLAETIRLYIRNASTITGGRFPIGNIPPPSRDLEWLLNDVLGVGIVFGPRAADLLFFGIVILAIWVVYYVLERSVRSPWGRVLKGIREDEDAAQALGKDTFRYKVQSFVLGAMVMGASGAFLAHLLRSISPDNFRPLESTFLIWIMVIVGGSGNNKGAILGAFLVSGLFSLSLLFTATLQASEHAVVSWIGDNFAFIRLMAIGAVLILLMMFRPQGLLGEERVISKVG